MKIIQNNKKSKEGKLNHNKTIKNQSYKNDLEKLIN